jgi:hypothetical protein
MQQDSRISGPTIEGLLEGTEQARYPDLSQGAMTFKKAPKEQKAEQVEVFN